MRVDEVTDEEVVMQIGHATHLPQHAQYFRFTTSDEMLQWYRTARIVVAHGGASAVEILYLEKPLVAVPRQAKYREHLDDHQLDFVRAMERRGLVTAVYDVERLGEILTGIKPVPVLLDNTCKQMLITALQEYLCQFEAESRS